MLASIMTAAATDGAPDNRTYEHLRREFMFNDELQDLLPAFVRAHRDLGSFRTWTQGQSPHWRHRRALISEGFTPLLDYLEGKGRAPGDMVVSDTLETFDAEAVHSVWNKAIARRTVDPEGAITIARTLLETACKRILDERQIPYTDTEDPPKLYGMAAKALNLAPSQHTEEPIKAILGGAMSLVNGLGTLRNRLSDSHGRGGMPVRPSPRHASLAVLVDDPSAEQTFRRATQRSHALRLRSTNRTASWPGAFSSRSLATNAPLCLNFWRLRRCRTVLRRAGRRARGISRKAAARSVPAAASARSLSEPYRCSIVQARTGPCNSTASCSGGTRP